MVVSRMIHRHSTLKMYKDAPLPTPPKSLVENPVPSELLDQVVLGDAKEILAKLPDNCIHLMVTSPPYNVGKEYDEDLLSLIHI